MCKGYYSIYLYMGKNALICGRSTNIYVPEQIINIELNHDIVYGIKGNSFFYEVDIYMIFYFYNL